MLKTVHKNQFCKEMISQSEVLPPKKERLNTGSDGQVLARMGSQDFVPELLRLGIKKWRKKNKINGTISKLNSSFTKNIDFGRNPSLKTLDIANG